MERALTIEDIMEHWSIKSRKTAIALVAGTPELHAYQLRGTWYVEPKYMQKFIDDLCKTRGTPRNRTHGGMSIVIAFDSPWAYSALEKAGFTDDEIKRIIAIEKVNRNGNT